VRVVTDSNGTVVTRHDYYPFGEEYGGAQPGDARRFTGQERDGETGLDEFGARYYRSGMGRFTSVDPVMSGALTHPQRWNRYAYALNNPLRMIDPDGMNAEENDLPGFADYGDISWDSGFGDLADNSANDAWASGEGGSDPCSALYSCASVAAIVYNEVGSLRQQKDGPTLDSLYQGVAASIMNDTSDGKVHHSTAPASVSKQTEKEAVFKSILSAVIAAHQLLATGKDPSGGGNNFRLWNKDPGDTPRYKGNKYSESPMKTKFGPFVQTIRGGYPPKGPGTWVAIYHEE
jgi:RHS repeat-associated protein